VKWYGKYGRKRSRIVNRFGIYGRKVNSEMIWKILKKIEKKNRENVEEM
jgi:hypothetical protein